jgi:hypothetical protein
MANTLEKIQRFTAPPPPAPVPAPIVRTYRVARTYPQTKLIQVATAAQADFSQTIINYVTLSDGRIFPSQQTIYWKRVSAGVVTVYETATETIYPPAPPPAVSTPVPAAWDATAWSGLAYTDPMQATFNVGAGVTDGVIAGLAITAPTSDTVQSHIVHGFKIENGLAYVHISPPPGVPPAPGETVYVSAASPVSPGDECKVSVVAGRVRYYVEDVLVAESPSYLAGSAARLSAAIYAPDDELESPTFAALDSTGTGEAPFQLSALGGDYGYAFGAAELYLGATGEQRESAAGLGTLWAYGSDRDEGNGLAQLGGLDAVGYGYTGETGDGSAPIFQLDAIGGDYAYASGAAELMLWANGDGNEFGAELVGYARGIDQWAEGLATYPHRGIYTVGQVLADFDASVSPSVRHEARGLVSTAMKGSLSWIMEFVTRGRMGVNWNAQRVVDVALVSTGNTAANLSGILVISASLPTPLVASATIDTQRTFTEQLVAGAQAIAGYDAQQVISAAIEAVVYGGVAMGEPGKNLSVWSVNPESGSAAYENFPFNSFARIGGRNYGASEAGIFELMGDDDAGAPIRASINLGKRDFGSPALKGISYAYLGVKSTGQMVVRVTTPEGKSYLYQTRSADAFMATQRADFGKGLRAHYLELEIYNQEGADFTLERMEFVVNELKRRI